MTRFPLAQQVTLKDIARHTNLSVAAVSKALAGYPQVSQQTRDRVKAASEALNYQPRPRVNRSRLRNNGRGAEAGRGKRINFILTETWDERADQWLPALAKAGQRVGLRMELSYAEAGRRGPQQPDAPSSLAHWEQTIRDLSRQTDGLLLFGCFDIPQLHAAAQANMPTVVMGDMILPRAGQALPVHWISTDKVAMGKLATHTLLSQGHKRIGFFCGMSPQDGWNQQWWMGHRIALMQADIPMDPALACLCDIHDFARIAQAAAKHYLAMDKQRPKVYMTPSVNVAAIFVKIMANAGVHIGPDQLVIGGHIDDARAHGLGQHILLDEPVEQMALHAMDLLARLIHGDNLPPAEILVPFDTHNMPTAQRSSC